MHKVIFKTALSGLIAITLFSCDHKNSGNNTQDELVISHPGNDSIAKKEPMGVPQIPEIVNITKSPDKLTKQVNTYTVTLTTEGVKVKPEDTEFSLNGKDWQKSGEFQNLPGGEYTFYARNKRDKSLQSQKKMNFECFVDVPVPTIPQLNELLKQIADGDDKAIDEFRKFGKNLPVRGVANINNIEQLVIDACTNEVIYVVQKINTDANGNLATILISKK